MAKLQERERKQLDWIVTRMSGAGYGEDQIQQRVDDFKRENARESVVKRAINRLTDIEKTAEQNIVKTGMKVGEKARAGDVPKAVSSAVLGTAGTIGGAVGGAFNAALGTVSDVALGRRATDKISGAIAGGIQKLGETDIGRKARKTYLGLDSDAKFALGQGLNMLDLLDIPVSKAVGRVGGRVAGAVGDATSRVTKDIPLSRRLVGADNIANRLAELESTPDNPALVKYRIEEVPTKADEVRQVTSGAKTADVAKPSEMTIKIMAKKLNEPGKVVEPVAPVRKKLEANKRVVKDLAASELVRQGVDDATVAIIKNGSDADMVAFRQMFDHRIKNKKNPIFRKRPTDVVGKNFEEYIKFIKDQSKQANIKVREAAKGLRGLEVDITPARDEFYTTLSEYGVLVELDDTGKLKFDFSNAEFEHNPAAHRLIKNIADSLNNAIERGDGASAHRVKKVIDDAVEYGSTSDGSLGQAERIVKSLRRDIDTILDSNFEEYRVANESASELLGALDYAGEVLGRKYEPGKVASDTRLGAVLLQTKGNSMKRGEIDAMVEIVQNIARDYGMSTNDDIFRQITFADMLDDVFEKPMATTSLGGRVQRALETTVGNGFPSVTSMMIRGAFETANKLRGINAENAQKAVANLIHYNLK